MVISRFLDPKNDVAFKKIFGSEKNKDILLDFLNDVLVKTKKEKIIDITFLNTVQQPEIAVQKQSIIDVLCVDNVGARYIVEMQVAKTSGFEKRAQYYASKAYYSQMKSGEAYDNLKEVIFLAIVDFVMFPNKKSYKSDHIIFDTENGHHDLKDFYFTFIELPKFKKERVEDLTSDEEKWCYFFKHSHENENISKLLEQDATINKAYHQLQSYNWNEDELALYEKAQKIELDNAARDKYLLDHGRELGREEGVEIGIEKGIELGREEGREEGVAEALRKTAINMINQNLDDSLISSITGLSIDEIKKLRKN